MKVVKKLLNINQIKENKEIYPRNSVSWVVIMSYSSAMKNGNVFPPIKVARLNNRYILIDGKHRLEAMKYNKEKHVEAMVTSNLTKNEAYVEAIRSNIIHGHQFSPYEKRLIIVRLRDLKYDNNLISKIVNMPVSVMKSFVGNSIANSVTGEKYVLKAPLGNLAGTDVDSDLEREQEPFTTNSQVSLIDQAITLLRNPKLFDFKKVSVKKLFYLRKLVDELIFIIKSQRKRKTSKPVKVNFLRKGGRFKK